MPLYHPVTGRRSTTVPGKDRQRALARAKLERQMARHAASARRRRQLQAGLGAAVAVIVVVAGVWFLAAQLDSGKADTANAANTAQPDAGACLYTKTSGEPPAKDVGVPTVGDVVRTGTQTVTLQTDAGPVVAELDLAGAPCTVHSFVHLAKQKYFDGTSCHRLLDSSEGGKSAHVLQCGDPTGTSGGGPGYQFADENLPIGKTPAYPTGTLAMANGGPGTNGSQFFIVFKDSTAFDPAYTVFGKVTKGLDAVQKVAAAGIQPGSDKPKQLLKINSVTVAPPQQ
jgi:peptidyl-prolyl cis-trans isomerase B (cyclophilin B)